MISYGLLQMDQSKSHSIGSILYVTRDGIPRLPGFLVPSCIVASIHGCHVKSKHCLALPQPNILVLSLSNLVIMLVSSPTVNHVFKLMRSSAAVSFQQASTYPHSFQQSVAIKLRSITLRVQLISRLISLAAMPLIVSVLIAKYIPSWNAKRSQLSFVYRLKMSYRVVPNSPSLSEVPGLLSSWKVRIWRDVMPTLFRVHVHQRKRPMSKTSSATSMWPPLLAMVS